MRILHSLSLEQQPNFEPIRWRKAGHADLGLLAAFLSAREERCAGFSGRLLRGGELQLPSSLRGGVFLAERVSGLAGALLCHPSRLAMPLLPPGREGRAADEELGGLLAGRGWKPATALGSPDDLERLGALCGIEIRVSVDYHLMSLVEAGDFRPPPPAPSVRIRQAKVEDLEALLLLQTAYEYEEVLTPLHRFDAAACRAALGRSLREQLMFVAEEDGTVVAKAGSNARGLGCDQIGGVYTLPERRGWGIGLALVGALVSAILAGGRSATLFVKPGNAAAISLYRRLGFSDIGPYRADYFDA